MDKKKKYLIYSILLDIIGYFTYAIPLVAELGDIIWAPIAGYIGNRMYGDKNGKTAFLLPFIEEILPWTDFIPSFTILWFYNFVIKKDQIPNE